MTDRIEEIKACSKKGINYREDVPLLLGEIERLKMMLDAATSGQETMQKQWAADVDRLTAEVEEFKGLPKKPNKFDGYQCPECGGKLARQTDLVRQKYCHHCGQELMW